MIEDPNASAEQLERQQRWPQLIGLLLRQAESASAPEARVTLLLRIAGLYLDKFANVGEAIQVYERVLEIEPDNATAIGALGDIYPSRREWAKLVALRERELAKLTDRPGRAKLLSELARLVTERSSDRALARSLWQRVLSEQPGDDEALAELQNLVDGGAGKKLAAIGAAMIASSILLGIAGALLGLPASLGGRTLNNVLEFGGLPIGIVGMFMWRVLKK